MQTCKKLFFFSAITLLLIACSNTSSQPDIETLTGSWLITSINDNEIIPDSQVTLTFNNNNRLSGKVSCNNISSKYSLTDNKFTTGPVATTRMMCPSVLMNQEALFLKALSQVKRFQITKGQLLLLSQQGILLIEANRARQSAIVK